MGFRYLWALMLVVTLPAARGIWMELGSRTSGGVHKCVSEELHQNVVVLGNYYAFYGHDDRRLNDTSVNFPSISVEISSPHGKKLHHAEKVHYGEFGFTSPEPGSYTMCLWVVDGERQAAGRNVTAGLNFKTGIATKDYDAIAKKEKIEGLDLEFRKLEDAVDEITLTLRNRMAREMTLGEANEDMNARVAFYGIVSLSVSVVVSIVQVMYLRGYFLKKKLI